VLGPSLFTVFMDDVDDCIMALANIIKFADDTNAEKSLRASQTWKNCIKSWTLCANGLTLGECASMQTSAK
jgi:hypothetical protein